MKLSSKEALQIADKGITVKDLEQQLNTFKEGIPFVKLLDYASLGNGILKLDEKQKSNYINVYDNAFKKILVFVPASGAATRMFKQLHPFLESVKPDETSILQALETKAYSSLKLLFYNLEKIAFYRKAKMITSEYYPDLNELSQLEQAYVILKTNISNKGLNLSNLPKGLIEFHDYEDTTRTAFEDHLEEAKTYAAINNELNLHFTISENHKDIFQKVLQNYLGKKQDIDFNVEFSFQKPSTDTIAVRLDNLPYRNAQGELFFRPGGHGSLIYNINTVNADLVFIKNIDNISKKNNYKEITSSYRKILAGKLISLQTQIFNYIIALKKEASKALIDEVSEFMDLELNIKSCKASAKEIIEQLDKPIRVCGMVKNDGAPGGGPFWILDDNNQASLQIVETSQIDTSVLQQKQILENATHFNPVDIICGLKNHNGETFDLIDYVNPKRGFIVEKSIKGKPVKALERPGLWNGAMENWISIFVEVPSETFNPVKTVVDLLKPAHVDD